MRNGRVRRCWKTRSVDETHGADIPVTDGQFDWLLVCPTPALGPGSSFTEQDLGRGAFHVRIG